MTHDTRLAAALTVLLTTVGCQNNDPAASQTNTTALADMQQQIAQMQADARKQQALIDQQQQQMAQQDETPPVAELPTPVSAGPTLAEATTALSNALNNAAEPETEAESINFAIGPLVDVYILEDVPDRPIEGDGNNDTELLEFIGRPNVESAGTMIGTAPLGDYKSFLEDETLAMFRNEIIGVETHGYLNLAARGRHGFAIELATTAHIHPHKGRYYPACSMSFSLGGKVRSSILVGSPARVGNLNIHEARSKPVKDSPEGYLASFDSYWKRFVNVFESQWFETTSVNIPEPGVYAASIWTVCTGVNPEYINTTVRMRTPADRALRPVSPEEFWHAE